MITSCFNLHYFSTIVFASKGKENEKKPRYPLTRLQLSIEAIYHREHCFTDHTYGHLYLLLAVTFPPFYDA